VSKVRQRLIAACTVAALALVGAAVPSQAAAPGTTISLSAASTQIQWNQSAQLNASVTAGVMGLWDWLSIYDETGHMMQACSVGSCAAGGRVPIHGSHTYTAYLASSAPSNNPPTSPSAVSGSVTVTNIGWVGSVTLTATSGSGVQAQASASLDGYPYLVSIYDQTGHMVQACSVSSCAGGGSLAPGDVRFYRAFVAQGAPLDSPPGNDVEAVSDVVVVSSVPADQLVDTTTVAALIAQVEAAYPAPGEACLVWGSAIIGNAQYKASATDATLECNALGLKAALVKLIETAGVPALAALLDAAFKTPTAAPTETTPDPTNPYAPSPRAPWGQPGPTSLTDLTQVVVNMYQLSTIGPSTQPAPSASQLTTTAQECIQRVQAGFPGGPIAAADKCSKSRLLVVGGAAGLGKEAAEHNATVLAVAPQLVQLEHVTTAEKEATVYRYWYKSEPYWSACDGLDTTTQQCDEYPLFATAEGGPDAYNAYGPVVLRAINLYDNAREGTVYGAMVGTSACGFTRPGSDQHFLAVPLPSVDVPTFFVCPPGTGS
jgi:hypothetical protein